MTDRSLEKLGVIGGGTMGAAIVGGGLAAGVLRPEDVVVAEPDPRRRDAMAALGCRTVATAAAAAGADQVLLAVKPQVFPDVAATIAPLSRPTVVISIMAGLGSPSIRRALGPHARVVRAMPNTPARIGAGMTAVATGDGAWEGDEAFALALFDAVGETVVVDEDRMYAVTAVSGSGPAYVFLLAEAMERAAIELALSPEEARRLVAQTILGAGRLLTEPADASGALPDAAALRRAVTSPGGTTAAALAVMEEGALADIVVRAITAARDRGVELGEQS